MTLEKTQTARRKVKKTSRLIKSLKWRNLSKTVAATLEKTQKARIRIKMTPRLKKKLKRHDLRKDLSGVTQEKT